jgi:hypothetical protein
MKTKSVSRVALNIIAHQYDDSFSLASLCFGYWIGLVVTVWTLEGSEMPILGARLTEVSDPCNKRTDPHYFAGPATSALQAAEFCIAAPEAQPIAEPTSHRDG